MDVPEPRSPSLLATVFDPTSNEPDDDHITAVSLVGVMLHPFRRTDRRLDDWFAELDDTAAAELARALRQHVGGDPTRALHRYLRVAQEAGDPEVAAVASVLASVVLAHGVPRRVTKAREVIESALTRSGPEGIEAQVPVEVSAVLELHLGLLAVLSGDHTGGVEHTEAARQLARDATGTVATAVAEVAAWNLANFSPESFPYPGSSARSAAVELRSRWLAAGQASALAKAAAGVVRGRAKPQVAEHLPAIVLHDECIGDWAGQRRSRRAAAHALMCDLERDRGSDAAWPFELFRLLHLAGDTRLQTSTAQHVRQQGPTKTLAEFVTAVLEARPSEDTVLARVQLLATAGDLLEERFADAAADEMWTLLESGHSRRYMRGAFATAHHGLRALSQLVFAMSVDAQRRTHQRLHGWITGDFDDAADMGASRVLWHLDEGAWSPEVVASWVDAVEGEAPLPRAITSVVLLRLARQRADWAGQQVRMLAEQNLHAYGSLLMDVDADAPQDLLDRLADHALDTLERESSAARAGQRTVGVGVPQLVILAALLTRGHVDDRWDDLVEHVLDPWASPAGRASALETLAKRPEAIPATSREQLIEGLGDPDRLRDAFSDGAFSHDRELPLAALELRAALAPADLGAELIDLLSSERPEERAAAARTLDRVPGQWGRVLELLLREHEATVRRAAAEAATRLVLIQGRDSAHRDDLLRLAGETGVAVPLGIAEELRTARSDAEGQGLQQELRSRLGLHPSRLVRRVASTLHTED